MNCRAIARTSIRVLLFGSCLLAARVVLSVVLQNRIVDGLIIGLAAIAIIQKQTRCQFQLEPQIVSKQSRKLDLPVLDS